MVGCDVTDDSRLQYGSVDRKPRSARFGPPGKAALGGEAQVVAWKVGNVRQRQEGINKLSSVVAQLVECRTGTPLKQVRFPGAARDFSPRVSLQCTVSHGARTPLCAVACINICAHVKDPVVHVRVRWIMETLKHPT